MNLSTLKCEGHGFQTCMAEVAPLQEVVLDDREVLLDEGCQGGALAMRPQLLRSIQRMRVLQPAEDISHSCCLSSGWEGPEAPSTQAAFATAKASSAQAVSPAIMHLAPRVILRIPGRVPSESRACTAGHLKAGRPQDQP